MLLLHIYFLYRDTCMMDTECTLLWTRSHEDTVSRYRFRVFRESQPPAIFLVRYDIDSQGVEETNKLRHRHGSISYHIETSKYLKSDIKNIKNIYLFGQEMFFFFEIISLFDY